MGISLTKNNSGPFFPELTGKIRNGKDKKTLTVLQKCISYQILVLGWWLEEGGYPLGKKGRKRKKEESQWLGYDRNEQYIPLAITYSKMCGVGLQLFEHVREPGALLCDRPDIHQVYSNFILMVYTYFALKIAPFPLLRSKFSRLFCQNTNRTPI